MDSLVTIIIPVYNVEKYVTQALESATNQTYRNIEIIAIDDGSIDRSGTICDEYAKKDIRIRVIHQENKGLATVRNIGVREANGEYISFLDSDDWMELNAIEEMIKATKDTHANIITANFSSEYIGKTKVFQNASEMQTYHGEDILYNFGNGKFNNVVWNKLYHYLSIKDIHFPDGYNYEDVATTWKIMKRLSYNNGTVVSLSERLFHHRIRKTSISGDKLYKNTIDCWNAYHTKYKALPMDEPLRECFASIGKMLLCYNNFSKDEKQKSKRVILEMKQFSTDHFRQIGLGTASLEEKSIYFLSRWSSPFVLWLCSIIEKIRTACKNIEYRKYE